MALKIHEYPNQALTLNKGDFFDIDKDVNEDGSLYQTNKVAWETIKSQFHLMTQIEVSASLTGIIKQSLIGAYLGTLEVPENGFKVGDTFHMNMSGLLRSADNETIEVFIETATGVILAQTGLITLPTITNKVWEMELDFVVRAIGVAGVAQIATTGEFTYNKDSNDRFEGKGFFSINASTFDTTISNTLDVKVQFGSTNGTNRINSQITYLNKKY